jgi:hypothetical protein
MEQNSSLDSNSHLANQEIPGILWDLNVQSPFIIHVLTPYFFTI